MVLVLEQDRKVVLRPTPDKLDGWIWKLTREGSCMAAASIGQQKVWLWGYFTSARERPAIMGTGAATHGLDTIPSRDVLLTTARGYADSASNVDRFTLTAPGMSPTSKQSAPYSGIGFPGYVIHLTYPMKTFQ